MNSSAVRPIRFWSSVSSAGENTSSGVHDSTRKLPPRDAARGNDVVAMVPPGSEVICNRRLGQTAPIRQRCSGRAGGGLDLSDVRRRQTVLTRAIEDRLQIVRGWSQTLFYFRRNINLRRDRLPACREGRPAIGRDLYLDAPVMLGDALIAVEAAEGAFVNLIEH